MDPIYEYTGIRGVSDYRQFFPETEFRHDHFLAGIVKCIVKTLFRMATLSHDGRGNTDPTMRIFERKLEKCFQELQFYLLNKATKQNVTPIEAKNMAKQQILEVLQIIRRRIDEVITENDREGRMVPYTRNMRGMLNTVIRNVETENFKNMIWPPSRLMLTRRQDTPFLKTSKQFSDLQNMSTVSRIRNLEPAFRRTLEEYLEPSNYGNSGTRTYERRRRNTKKTRKTR